MVGQDAIEILKNCKDDCPNCPLRINNKSCKGFKEAWQRWANERHKKFEEFLNE